MAYFCGSKIEKILIYPLGGISKFSSAFNISILKEFFILVFGPVFQILAWCLLIHIFPDKEKMISMYHFGIFFFNLLPIYPLDGGKLICLFFQLFVSYKGAYFFTFLFGYLLVFCFLYFYFVSFSCNVLFIAVFLFIKLTSEVFRVPYYYERFLLERYLNCYHFRKSKIIHSMNQFQRGYRHLIQEGDKYYVEREYLEKKYKKCVKH